MVPPSQPDGANLAKVDRRSFIYLWGTRRPAQTLWGRSAPIRLVEGRFPGLLPRHLFDYIAPGELEPGVSTSPSRPHRTTLSFSSPAYGPPAGMRPILLSPPHLFIHHRSIHRISLCP